MFTIRKEQFAVFEQNEIAKFEHPTYLHLNELFPKTCQDLGETQLRKMIRYGIERASSYGITAPDDVRTYIDIMMLLVPDFDKAPEYPWAEKILTDENIKDPKIRVTRLHEAAAKLHSEKV